MCPLQFDLQQAYIYCDPELVLEEGCCEILPGGVSGLAPAPLGMGELGYCPGVQCAGVGGPGRGCLEILGWVVGGGVPSVLTPALPPHWAVPSRDLQGPAGHPGQ